ncbi:MAG: hypothetical protein ACFN9G_12795, partial [Cardiobacterium sp.]
DQAVARARLDYTPGKESVIFFDANARKIARPVESGYFSRTLGKTADGRTVVQDFWQDTATKQTAPYVLTQRAAATDGGGIATLLPPLQAGKALGRALARLRAPDGADGVVDSTVVLYNRNGAVVFIIPAHAGKQVGFTGYYEDGRLRAQLPPLSHGSDTADSELPEFPAFATAHSRMYYPDGRLLALLPQDNAANGLILFYRADGSLLATINPDREPSVRLWDGAGTPLTEGTTAYQAATAELQPLLQQVKAMDRRVRQSRLEFSHGVRRNAQGVRVVAVSGIDVPLRVDNILPEAIRDADKAAKAENITYIAGEAQTFYYDADGKKTAQPAPGGYFRKLVGKTADGRIVAQDFYQDSGKPQTALFILRADAAADDFRTTDVFRAAMADSPVVTYGRTGTVVYRVDYPVQADNTTHRTGVYHEGRLLAQHALLPGTRDPDDPLSELSALPDYYRYFYPDGRLQLLSMGEKRGDGIRAAYRADGSLLMSRSTMADGGTETWWSADGMLLEEGTAAYRAAVQEYEML